jgi:hypothetical protein
MTTLKKLANGQFALSVTVRGETRLLIVHDASGQAIGTSDILSAEGVRAAAKRLIQEHQQRIASAKGAKANDGPFG